MEITELGGGLKSKSAQINLQNVLHEQGIKYDRCEVRTLPNVTLNVMTMKSGDIVIVIP